jgi:hypothetical protein
MQNDTTFTRADAAAYDSALSLTVANLATGSSLADLRKAFVDFVGDAKAGDWFDWEFGTAPSRRYSHSTLSNGRVISE